MLRPFLIELHHRLEPKPMSTIEDALIHAMQMMRNSSVAPYVPPDFSPPKHIVIINALFYASLGVLILVAVTTMLIKRWVREFGRILRAMSVPEQRAKTRDFRYLEMKRRRLTVMFGILPSLIQLSLLLFAFGFILFLFHIGAPLLGISALLLGITAAIFAFNFGMLYYDATSSFVHSGQGGVAHA